MRAFVRAAAFGVLAANAEFSSTAALQEEAPVVKEELVEKKLAPLEEAAVHREPTAVHHVHHDEVVNTRRFPTIHGFLNGHDPVAISFWIISIAMIASTVFFLMEAMCVKTGWKTSMHVGALVTLVAAVHYLYMREYWIVVGGSPIVYRYIDWTITVPLQMVEFYLILSAVNPNISAGMFWRLLVGTVIMLAFGYAGESMAIHRSAGFIGGMCGWGFILFEIFAGEAGKCAADSSKVSPYVRSAFSSMRLIVTVGWSIYPLGYFFGCLNHSVHPAPLNFIYNVADFVNKIAFCLAIWHAAKKDTLASMRG